MLRRGGGRWELKGTPPRFFLFGAGSSIRPMGCAQHTRADVRLVMVRPRTLHKSAFTLIEALIAISIMAIAGGAIMLALTSATQTTRMSTESAIATGIAERLVDEVVGQRYAAQGAGPYQTTLVANSWELAGQGRERYDDTDDYNGFIAQPVEGVGGLELGQGDENGNLRPANFRAPTGYFSSWREEIEVYYVDATNHSVRLPSGSTSDFRCVEVRIVRDNPDGSDTELANLRRVYAYVPAPQ